MNSFYRTSKEDPQLCLGQEKQGKHVAVLRTGLVTSSTWALDVGSGSSWTAWGGPGHQATARSSKSNLRIGIEGLENASKMLRVKRRGDPKLSERQQNCRRAGHWVH